MQQGIGHKAQKKVCSRSTCVSADILKKITARKPVQENQRQFIRNVIVKELQRLLQKETPTGTIYNQNNPAAHKKKP